MHLDTYVRAYQAPGAVRGAMADYRANAEDVAQDIADADMPKVWAEMATNLVTHAIPQSGHLPQEEPPEVVTRLLMDFLKTWRG